MEIDDPESRVLAWYQRFQWNVSISLDTQSPAQAITDAAQADQLGQFIGQLHRRSHNLEASCLFTRSSQALEHLAGLAVTLPAGPLRRRGRDIVRRQSIRRDCLVYGNLSFVVTRLAPLTVGAWSDSHFGGMPLDVAAFLATHTRLARAFWSAYRSASLPWSSDEEYLATALAALLLSDRQLLLFDIGVEDFLNAVGGP